MRIVVLDGYTLNPGDNPWEPVETLGDLTVYARTARELVIPRARDADIVLTNKTPIDAATIRALPQLKFISVLATGYNIVDVEAARRRGIPVANVPEYGTNSVAEHVFAVTFELVRRAAELDQLVHQDAWSTQPDFCFWKHPLYELHGKRMGIIGFGRIGRRVGALASAFGMEVIAHDIRQDNPPTYASFAWASVEQVFAEADIVTLHCPQTDANWRLVSAGLLGTMKRTALLVNAARGGLVDEADLCTALNNGIIAGAAVDVLSAEPPAADHPLLHAKNCLITPHVAWAAVEARRRMTAITADNIRSFIAGTPINIVH